MTVGAPGRAGPLSDSRAPGFVGELARDPVEPFDGHADGLHRRATARRPDDTHPGHEVLERGKDAELDQHVDHRVAPRLDLESPMDVAGLESAAQLDPSMSHQAVGAPDAAIRAGDEPREQHLVEAVEQQQVRERPAQLLHLIHVVRRLLDADDAGQTQQVLEVGETELDAGHRRNVVDDERQAAGRLDDRRIVVADGRLGVAKVDRGNRRDRVVAVRRAAAGEPFGLAGGDRADVADQGAAPGRRLCRVAEDEFPLVGAEQERLAGRSADVDAVEAMRERAVDESLQAGAGYLAGLVVRRHQGRMEAGEPGRLGNRCCHGFASDAAVRPFRSIGDTLTRR